MTLFAFVVAITLNHENIEADKLPPIPTDVKGMIVYFAKQNSIKDNELLVVAKCESTFNQSAIGDHGKARGIFQYHKPTFDRFSELMGQDLDYYSAHDQAKLTAFVFAQYPQYKSHWTCFSKNFKV